MFLKNRLLFSALLFFTIALSISACKKFSSDDPVPDPYTPTLFISSNNQVVYALDPNTGKYKWKLKVEGDVKASPVVLSNGLIVGTEEGHLYKIDKHRGAIIRSRNFGGGTDAKIIGTPLFFDNTLFVAVGNTVHQLNPETFETIQTFSNGEEIVTSLKVHRVAGAFEDGEEYGNCLFIATTGNTILAVRLANWERLWEYTPQDAGSFQSSPCVISDSFLYIGNDNYNVYALNTYDGTEKWVFPTNGQVQSSPILVDGNVLVGSNDRYFYSIDSEQGQLRWRVKTEGMIISSPSFINQKVYFGSYDFNIYCVDVLDGTILWKKPTFGLIKSSPLVYETDVYYSSFDKNLYKAHADNSTERWLFDVQGQMECSPVLDLIDKVIYPSIHGNYEYQY